MDRANFLSFTAAPIALRLFALTTFDFINADAEAYIAERYRATVESSSALPGTDAGERRQREMVNLNFRWFMQTLLEVNVRT
jgi:hypothetical protein